MDTLGTVILAMLSGAGGSAILEFWIRPRRERTKAAGLLLAEVAQNTQLLILWAHTRMRDIRKIPEDLTVSTRAWETVGSNISELPQEELRRLTLLYTRYDDLNRIVDLYAKAVDEFHDLEDGPKKIRARRYLDTTIDVFNTTVDNTIETGKKLIGPLMALSGWVDRGDPTTPAPDYASDVEKFLAERERRIQAIARRTSRNG